MKAFLILEDGTVFKGTSIGSTREVISEIVFNTSMTGYLEACAGPQDTAYLFDRFMDMMKKED
jgi:carbamoyl-phosphate synthase small subunit